MKNDLHSFLREFHVRRPTSQPAVLSVQEFSSPMLSPPPILLIILTACSDLVAQFVRKRSAEYFFSYLFNNFLSGKLKGSGVSQELIFVASFHVSHSVRLQ